MAGEKKKAENQTFGTANPPSDEPTAISKLSSEPKKLQPNISKPGMWSGLVGTVYGR